MKYILSILALVLQVLNTQAQEMALPDSLDSQILQTVVITGTRTVKRQTESPILVQVLLRKTLEQLQACSLADGLRFQPGMRIEVDCQTCNYTQLRMNGLQGGYSQILINGRPIFSAVTSLYGLEQLPVNMIERIEIVRGGGASLYGSSAIGGTVNVITRLPKQNGYELATSFQTMAGQASDQSFNTQITLLEKKRKTGTTFFATHRKRSPFDANQDGFSEMPLLNSQAVGMHSFLKLKESQKLEFSASYLQEYRLGGDLQQKPVPLLQQAEERTHRIWMANIDYQANFKKTSWIVYGGFQQTGRQHYTGILPDHLIEREQHLALPPYGSSISFTLNSGVQLNFLLSRKTQNRHVLTLGSEYSRDKVIDSIAAYRYNIDQLVFNWGNLIQSDWSFGKRWNLLSGLRIDKNKLLVGMVASPRIALLYKPTTSTQLRLSYGQGYRAPQAFDTDMHIAFAGGGVSRIRLAENLQEELSESLSSSINFDHPGEKMIFGFTLEGFYTRLSRAFALESIGQDDWGAIFEKRNSLGAIVMGSTLELRANYNRKLQTEAGFTWQKSRYNNAVLVVEGLRPQRNFLRTPRAYGYASANFTPNRPWSLHANLLYTGPMLLAHRGGATNFPVDALTTSPPFLEIGLRAGYSLPFPKLNNALEIYAGVKNALNSYQSDFDIGKNRDSNYIYGPGQPRSFYIGLKIKSD